MCTNILLADIEKSFHQIGIKEEDRDAFRFLFKIDGKDEHLRFARVPFGAEASSFILGATLQHHYNQQPSEYEETVQSLRDNTYVDNLMAGAEDFESLERFKVEAMGKRLNFPYTNGSLMLRSWTGRTCLIQAKFLVIIGTNKKTP